MIVAVIALAALLLAVTLVAHKTRPVAPAADNVVSLDAYRVARHSGRRDASVARESTYHYLSASGGLSTAPTGGLRTCRQPDGRLGRPSARTEPA